MREWGHEQVEQVEQVLTKVLQVAPSAYRRHAARQRNPKLRSSLAKRDEVLMPEIERVWRASLLGYGTDKV